MVTLSYTNDDGLPNGRRAPGSAVAAATAAGEDDGVDHDLPPHEQGKASVLSSVSNLTNTIIGTGMLATPGAFRYTGLLLGMALICLCGFTAAFGLYLLTRCAARVGGRRNSFFSIASQTLPGGAWWFDLAIALKCYGVSISYLIICGQLMPQIITSFFKAFHRDPHQIPVLLLDRGFWIFVLMIMLIPLCFLRRLDSLRHTSYLSLLAVFYLVVIVIHYSLSSEARATLPPAGEIHLVTFSYHTISIFPVFVFAFTCAQNMLSVYNELFQNNEARVNTAIAASIGTGGCVYQIVGVLGYFAFGSNVGDNIITMYPSTSLFVCFGRVSIVVLTVFSYPLQIHPCRASLDKVLSRSSCRQLPLDAASASLLSQTSLPAQPYRDDDGDDNNHGTSNASNANGQAQRSPRMPGLSRRNFSTASRLTIYEEETPLWKWCAMTGGILSTTFVISLLVDDLSIILGFVGSVGSTTISFILPGILYASLYADEPNSRTRCGAQVLAAWGMLVLVVALSANILKLFHAPVPSPVLIGAATRAVRR